MMSADRLVIGVSTDPAEQDLSAALVRVRGVGVGCRPETLTSWCESLIRGTDAPAKFAPVAARAQPPIADLTFVASCVAAGCLAVVERARGSLTDVLTVGLTSAASPDASWDGATLAARLAELSGITVVSGLADQDRAAGGRGGPLDAMVDWQLAHDPYRSRLVVHLDGLTRVTYVPAGRAAGCVQAFDVGPGTEWLGELASSLSRHARRAETAGLLAVQGRQLKPLIRHWAGNAFLRRTPPKWAGADEFRGAFVEDSLRLAVERGWSAADILCTATHFVAACPADAVRHLRSADRQLDEVAIVGRGAGNGLLLRFLEEQFAAAGVRVVTLGAVAAPAYDAVSAAMLACLTLDGVEANVPAVTGAAASRLLGHFTPGTAANWRRVIEWMQQASDARAVRAA